MGVEIERKFLLNGSDWKQLGEKKHYKQGYLSSSGGSTVRVRVIGEEGILTIKGKSRGLARAEFEYPIPLDDAEAILDQLCIKPVIEKYRYTIAQAGFVWEIDEFLGENEGLVVAEIELEHEDQHFEKPHWVGREVSDDPRYFNASLVSYPYSKWK